MIKKTAIIIGASSDIGKAISLQMAKSGWNLVLTYNSTPINNENDFCEKLKSYGCEAKFHKLDLCDKNATKSFFETITKDTQCVESLVFTSGIAQKRKLILDVTDEEIDQIFEINTKSAIRCIREFSKITSKDTLSSIVLVGSFVEKNGCSCESVYTASKSALTGLCKSLASELGILNIKINVVAPGFIDTKMNNNLSQEEKDEIAQMTPLQRLGNSTDIANAVEFLTSENSSFITGQTLFVDGGLVLE